MRLYRVASREEVAELRRLGMFRSCPTSMEAKSFWLTLGDAMAFARSLVRHGLDDAAALSIVEVHLEGGGAWFATRVIADGRRAVVVDRENLTVFNERMVIAAILGGRHG